MNKLIRRIICGIVSTVLVIVIFIAYVLTGIIMLPIMFTDILINNEEKYI
jgi:hypothetical protein